MKLSELFDLLASGELNNISLVNNYKINPEKQEVVLRSINLGLLDLYTRFMLKKNTIKIITSSSQDTYSLDTNDFIEILNHNLNGYLISNNTIKIPDPLDNEELIITYKAKHRELKEEDILNNADIELPASYLNALGCFIAARLLTSLPNQLDGDVNEGLRYTERYYQEIRMLENQGVDIDKMNEHSWFTDRGFV